MYVATTLSLTKEMPKKKINKSRVEKINKLKCSSTKEIEIFLILKFKNKIIFTVNLFFFI